MDLTRAIADLREEHKQIEEAILVLERIAAPVARIAEDAPVQHHRPVTEPGPTLTRPRLALVWLRRHADDGRSGNGRIELNKIPLFLTTAYSDP